MQKILKSLVVWWMLMWWVQQWLAQNRTIKETKKDTLEILINNHDTIIKTNFSNIIRSYGPEKWMEIIREHMLIAINNEREKVGLSKLQANKFLAKAAQGHAEFLNKNSKRYFSPDLWTVLMNPHVQFFVDGKPARVLRDRTMAAGYTGPNVTECIVAGAKNINQAIDGWMHSPAHKAAILNNGEYIDVDSWVAMENWLCISVLNFWTPDYRNREKK